MKIEQHIAHHVTGSPVTIDLGDGDSTTILVAVAPQTYANRMAELEFEARARLALDAGEDLRQRAPHLWSEISQRALVGTILMGWEHAPVRLEDGSVNVEAGLQLVRVPAVFASLMTALNVGTKARAEEAKKGKAPRSRRSSGA